jgi:hypothetical protein
MIDDTSSQEGMLSLTDPRLFLLPWNRPSSAGIGGLMFAFTFVQPFSRLSDKRKNSGGGALQNSLLY